VREPALRLRSRASPSSGPERDLIEGALAAGLVETFGGGAKMIREPELATGRPDMVFAFSRRGFDLDPSVRSGITHGDLQLLHHLWMQKGAFASDVKAMLALSERTLWDRVRRLLDAALLRVRSGYLAARSLDDIFGTTRIVAIEAKVEDWRRALEQAAANLWFASHSYVLFPQRRFLDAAVREAATLGIGVAVFDGASVKVRLRAARQRIPASIGSWIVNEWLVSTRYVRGDD
jgi:hypothetical protein